MTENPFSFVYQHRILKKPSAEIKPKKGEDITIKLGDAITGLLSSNNFNKDATPNDGTLMNSVETTLEDFVSLNVATAGSFMGISGENNFKYSSSEKNYHYLFTYEQRCVQIISKEIKSPADVFEKDTESLQDWLYINSVHYGRRLHILVNTSTKIKNYKGEQGAEVNWLVLSGSVNVKE